MSLQVAIRGNPEKTVMLFKIYFRGRWAGAALGIAVKSPERGLGLRGKSEDL